MLGLGWSCDLSCVCRKTFKVKMSYSEKWICWDICWRARFCFHSCFGASSWAPHPTPLNNVTKSLSDARNETPPILLPLAGRRCSTHPQRSSAGRPLSWPPAAALPPLRGPCGTVKPRTGARSEAAGQAEVPACWRPPGAPLCLSLLQKRKHKINEDGTKWKHALLFMLWN